MSEQIDRGRVVEALLAPRPSKSVVALPDFYLDHIVRYPYGVERFVEDVKRIAQQGGGNIIDIPQQYTLGGNASNFADTLARLGSKVYLIARTSPFGKMCLQHFLEGLKVDLTHVKVDSHLSTSSIVEMNLSGRLVNVMIGDAGGLKDFDANKLDEEDLKLLEDADYVCVFNWCQNKFGTELFLQVAKVVGRNDFGYLFIDIGDPSSRIDELKTLCEGLCKVGKIGGLGLNENEAYWVGKTLGCESEDRSELAAYISKRFEGEILLHTAELSSHNIKGEATSIPTFDVKPQKATGAGDCWNAGYILGLILDLSYTERIFLANAVAAAHITKPVSERITLDDVVRIVREGKLRVKS
ncbi:MAG: carbohydrate kinase family protein [Halobacteria archaeon]